MALDLGLHTTLNDSTSALDPEVIAIAERITKLQSPEFGQVWNLFGNRKPFITDEFEVLTRTNTAAEVVVTATGGGADWDTNSDTTALPVSAGTIDRITIGSILLVEDEIVVVKSVNRTGNTIDVYERGSGESAAAAHGTGAITAKVIGHAHREGTNDAEARAETTEKITNYLQLVEEVVDLSKEDSDQARKFGQTEEVLKAEAMERVIEGLARTAIYGVARQETSAIPAQTRGMLQHLNLSAGIKTAVSGAFTETSLKNILDDVREAGGTVNAIVMNVAKKRIANGFTGADAIQTSRSDREGGQVLDAYIADGLGRIPFIVDLDMPSDQVALVNTRFMEKGWKANDQLQFKPETNVGSREKKETLQGKFGLAMQQIGRSHAVLTDLS